TSKVTLSVAVASSVSPGDYYSVEVNATSGALNHPIFIPITVVGPDFTITTTTNPVTFNAGSTATSTITINPIMSFSDPVDLFVGSSSDLNATINPTTVTSGSYSATLSLNSTKPGYYTVDVFGSSSSGLFHDLTVQVVVSGPDFGLLASPATIRIAAGTSDSSTISVTTTLGFKGTIGLSSVFPPTGITATPTPPTITESQTSTVQIKVDPSVAPGPYTLDIQGISGSLKHDALITVNVASFDLTATPDTLTINQGSSDTSTINVASLNGFSNPVSLTTSPATGITATVSPPSVTGSGPSTLTIHTDTVSPGTYQVNVTGTSGLLIVKVTITVTVPVPDFTLAATSPASTPADGTTSATSTISFNPQNGFTGTVALIDTPLPSGLQCAAINPTSISGSQTASLSCTSTTAKTYAVTITGTSGSLVHTASVTFTFVPPPDFTITATNPSSAPADGTTVATSTITIGALNGFSSTVTLSYGTLPTGLTCTAFVPATITGSGTATLSCTSDKAGTYSVTITGTSSSSIHAAPATFTFDSFTISATSPAALDVGESAVSTVTVSPANGFTATVTLSDNPLPSGLTCLPFNPLSVTGSGPSALSCKATIAGSYIVTITGT
ncbi:MAG TPA: hypothetical protein VFV92_00350, partial [Candidatus Bathyarchaeia archaeon]|nr:hypothetical protein [Candidatus Bathyarchaeia archaeon]